MKSKIRKVLMKLLCAEDDSMKTQEKLVDQALSEILEIVKGCVPKKKECKTCYGKKTITDILGDTTPCPHCHLVFQWNSCIDQIHKNIDQINKKIGGV